ncbi:hypothetical protein LOCC1_G008365 [Lachnellula occidentalis]|uniref:RRM domain-containing protein n=1 Tax=Lachnellula occidentalis TaxID=215460 RepID=A0A8H8RKA9_9HELO|nr:hypothetical protein LOCC1_G008365 [Lachnellula occidentalis]
MSRTLCSPSRWHTTRASWEELKLAADIRFFPSPGKTSAPTTEAPMTHTATHALVMAESSASLEPKTHELALNSDFLQIRSSSQSSPQQDAHQRNSTPSSQTTQDFDTIFDVAMARAQAHLTVSTSSPVASIALATVTPPVLHQFRPNQMALAQQGLLASAHSSDYPKTRYQGEPGSHSHVVPYSHLPKNENCALFVTNIPRNVSPSDIFDQIDVGPVFALHINPADATHITQAAKLVFLHPEAAQLMKKKTIRMQGKLLGLRYNRHGYRRNNRDYSRVIIVEGPERVMNLATWDRYFRHYSDLVYDRVLDVHCATWGNKAYAFHFSRIDGQAETCLLAIKAEPSFQGHIAVRYGQDPCGA